MPQRHRAALLTLAFSALLGGGSPAASVSAATRIRMSGAETLIPQLAIGLGYFQQEGLEVTPSKVDDFAPHDYLDAEVLNKGHIDAAVWWYHHVLFGAGNGAPTQAVILLSDTPGMTVMVANPVKDEIRSAADFKGKRVAEGAGYSTKSYVTRYLAGRAGLPPRTYTPVALESEGRLEAIVKALKKGEIDVLTFNEPMTSRIMETGLVTSLYDLTTKEGTRKALGDLWPTFCVFLAPAYIEANPETVQHLVNAFVRTMRFVNTHTAEEIADKLPASYFQGKDRTAEIERIRKAMPTFTKGDYTFSRSAVQVVADAVFTADFDDSEEGRYRANAKKARGQLDRSYTNRFVEKALRDIPASVPEMIRRRR